MTAALHIAHDGGRVDLEAARRAAADFLSALGVAIDTEDLRDTPARMARAYAELFDARPLRLTTFANDEGYDDLVPYFYTDQYDLGMEYAGYVEPGRYDQVVFRGDVDRREFVAFWLAGGRVLAGMNVNIWDVNDAIQDLVSSGRQVDPARLADPAVPLDQVAG
jgi:3-phenylpropionate/trans-cinnamate dioxygenase ferredoxin reductase component